MYKNMSKSSADCACEAWEDKEGRLLSDQGGETGS